MYYHKLGQIPPKRHIQFRQPDGSLYKEELVSSRGFSGIYSNLYHIHAPTRVKALHAATPYGSEAVTPYELKQTHLDTSSIGITGTDYLTARKELLKNSDVTLSLCIPESRHMEYY